MPEPARMSGMLFSAAVSWIKSTYGNELFEKVMSILTETERNQFRKLILSIGWYDIVLFEKFCTLCYNEISKISQESRESFDRRGIEEGGGSMLKTVYKFFLSMTDPLSVLSRMPVLFKRTFSQGEMTVVQNTPGVCTIRFNVPFEMYETIDRNIKYGYPYLLRLSGAKEVFTEKKEVKEANSYLIIAEIYYKQ